MSQRSQLAILIFSLSLAGLWLAKRHSGPADDKASSVRTTATEAPRKPSSAAVPPAAPTASTPAPAAGTAPVVKAPEPPIPHATELAQYELLHRKVFLTEGEQGEKDRLLKDSSILRSMGTRLLRSPADRQAAEEQNSAITMLMEALRSGDREVAAQVLGTVVTDKQIENGQMDHTARENLAGVKADVLYQWRALQPDHEAALEKMLPGPVSQKIWQNVLSQQASNVAESVDAP